MKIEALAAFAALLMLAPAVVAGTVVVDLPVGHTAAAADGFNVTISGDQVVVSGGHGVAELVTGNETESVSRLIVVPMGVDDVDAVVEAAVLSAQLQLLEALAELKVLQVNGTTVAADGIADALALLGGLDVMLYDVQQSRNASEHARSDVADLKASQEARWVGELERDGKQDQLIKDETVAPTGNLWSVATLFVALAIVGLLIYITWFKPQAAPVATRSPVSPSVMAPPAVAPVQNAALDALLDEE